MKCESEDGMIIEANYRIHIVSPDDELLDTIDLAGYHLDSAWARVDIIETIQDEIAKHEARNR